MIKLKGMPIPKKELLVYAFFGVITTVVNFACFYLLAVVSHLDYRIANTIAWLVSVIFAYITNKIYVFHSKQKNFLSLVKEFALFIVFRLMSYALDMLSIIILIELFSVGETLSKIIVNILVVIFNYISGKYFTFKSGSRIT